MTPEKSYSQFRAFLKARNRTLKSLNVSDACEFMFEFYKKVLAVGTSPRMGDGIGFAYDTVQRARGTPYELSIVRLFAKSDEAPGRHGSRLRLSLGYAWNDAVGWFNQPDYGLPVGSSRFAWTRNSAELLRQELQAHDVYCVISAPASFRRTSPRITMDFDRLRVPKSTTQAPHS